MTKEELKKKQWTPFQKRIKWDPLSFVVVGVRGAGMSDATVFLSTQYYLKNVKN